MPFPIAKFMYAYTQYVNHQFSKCHLKIVIQYSRAKGIPSLAFMHSVCIRRHRHIEHRAYGANKVDFVIRVMSIQKERK